MPRPIKPGTEPKRRSRNGCWPCKARKVKCGEEKPGCANCERQGEICDYSIRFNWARRAKRDQLCATSEISSTASGIPFESTLSFEKEVSSMFPTTPAPPTRPQQVRSRSNVSPLTSTQFIIDPGIMRMGNTLTPPVPVRAVSVDRGYHFQSSNDLPLSAPYSQCNFEHTFGYNPSTHASNFDMFSYSNDTLAPVCPNIPSNQISWDTVPQHHKYSYPVNLPAITFADTNSPKTSPPTPYSPYRTIPMTPNSLVGCGEPLFQTVQTQAFPKFAKNVSSVVDQ